MEKEKLIDIAFICWISGILLVVGILALRGVEIPSYVQYVFATLTAAFGFKKASS